MLNISIVVPDPEANGVYIPFAKSQVRVFAEQWNGSYMSRVLKIEKATILMEVWSESQARVTISSEQPYMESGVLDHLTVLQGFPDAYKPSLVRFTPRVAVLSNTPGLPNATGHILSDGDETWTKAGCRPSEKTAVVDREIGTIGNRVRFVENVPTFCDPDAIVARKLLCELRPPSLFTGKMKLYVQALYGSLRSDFYLESTLGGTQFLMRTGEVAPDGEPRTVVFEHGLNTSGIFTIRKGKYLLVKITPAGIFYWKMKRGLSLGAGASVEKEAYVLADTTPKFESFQAVGPSMAGAVGAPLAYGWHFNEDGSRANAVLLTAEDLAGVLIYAGTPTTGYGVRGRHYQIDFTYSEGELSYTLSQLANEVFSPRSQTKIWSPSPTGVGMDLLSGFAGTVVYGNYGPAPVYCYYNMTDELRVVTVKNATLETLPVRNDMDGINQILGDQMMGVALPALPLRTEKTMHAGGYSFAQNGVRVGSDGFYGAMLYLPVGTSTIEIELHPNRRPGSPTPPDGDGDGNTFGYFDGFDFYSGYLYYASGVRSFRVDAITHRWYDEKVTAFVVPHGDASACLVGQEDLRQRSIDTVLDYEYGSNSPWYFSGGGSRAGVQSWSQFGALAWNPRTSEESRNAAIGRPLFVDSSISVAMRLYAGESEGELIASYSASESSTIVSGFPISPYKQLFAPTGAPFYEKTMTVRSSYFGAVRHDDCTPSATRDQYLHGWPTDGDTSIGWA